MTTTTPDRGTAGTGRIDVAGLIRRARRLADLSQRDLAARAGASPSTVGRAESGRPGLSVDTFQALLGAAGCRLAVLEPTGDEAQPMRGDAIRDNGDRRYPAHLDPRITPLLNRAGGGLHRDRPLPRLSLELRTARDARRRQDAITPVDHPGADDVRRFRERQRAEAERRYAFLRQSPPQPDCECGPECERECVPTCPCQCEPAGATRNYRSSEQASTGCRTRLVPW